MGSSACVLDVITHGAVIPTFDAIFLSPTSRNGTFFFRQDK